MAVSTTRLSQTYLESPVCALHCSSCQLRLEPHIDPTKKTTMDGIGFGEICDHVEQAAQPKKLSPREDELTTIEALDFQPVMLAVSEDTEKGHKELSEIINAIALHGTLELENPVEQTSESVAREPTELQIDSKGRWAKVICVRNSHVLTPELTPELVKPMLIAKPKAAARVTPIFDGGMLLKTGKCVLAVRLVSIPIVKERARLARVHSMRRGARRVPQLRKRSAAMRTRHFEQTHASRARWRHGW
ncbi:MAG: hypothetical protein MHM6MM_006305 [Cercozoa sp. M6MM]